MRELDITLIKKVSAEIGCGLSLTRDLLMLAGGDADLVINTSHECYGGITSVKSAIIDKRLSRIESKQ